MMIVENYWTILQTLNTGAGEREEQAPMDVMKGQRATWERQHAHTNREELVARIATTLQADGTVEPLPGLHLYRASSPTEPLHGVTAPAFCVIAQGSKVVLLGDHQYRYDPAHYLLATAELPVVGQIVEASAECPYLSLRLELTSTLVGSVMAEAGHPPRSHPPVRALDVSPLDTDLLDVVVRLVRLQDSPHDARFLAPLITREIIYRLLQGDQSGRLHQIATVGGYAHRIAEAIERIRKNFDQPLRIEDLAREVGMSVSGFHAHFKAVTALSPLQFQKQLRLQEARRLMLGEHLDAASAGYRVGYDDAAYFNREYRRLFGAPPMRDAARLREGARERVVGQGMA
jgi:AraC-like DNA-binding protein